MCQRRGAHKSANDVYDVAAVKNINSKSCKPFYTYMTTMIKFCLDFYIVQIAELAMFLV